MNPEQIENLKILAQHLEKDFKLILLHTIETLLIRDLKSQSQDLSRKSSDKQ